MDFIGASATFLNIAMKAGESLGEVITSPELEARLDRIPSHLGPYGVDPFGFDPQYVKKVMGFFSWLYRHYFRCECYGVDQIPDGRCFLVANHSGQLPFDGAMIGMAVFLEREPPRAIRSMVERFVPSTPFVSPFLARCGQILGTPDNCRRLLQAEEAIQVFPEGVRGLNKTWRHRYKLQRFGHGFARLALEMDAPIVPVAVIGAEEQAPCFANMKHVAKMMGMPAAPLTVPPLIGLLPLPTRYRIYFGEAIRLEGDYNDDDEVMGRKVEGIRTTLQKMIDDGVSARTHVFW